MSVAIDSARSRLRSQTRFAGAHPFIGEGAPHVLEQLGVKLFNGKGWDAFDRGERTVNDG
jgi:hypothetical protein